MTLVNPDSNGIKRYTETTAITTFSAFLNLILEEISAWISKTTHGRQTFAGETAGAGGLDDLGSVVSFASVPYATVVELDARAVVDLSASPPSGRTVILNFATTAGTLTEDVVTTVDWATSAPTAGSQRMISQRASVAIPASTAADIKLRWNPSASGVRIGASAWRYTRRPA